MHPEIESRHFLQARYIILAPSRRGGLLLTTKLEVFPKLNLFKLYVTSGLLLLLGVVLGN